MQEPEFDIASEKLKKLAIDELEERKKRKMEIPFRYFQSGGSLWAEFKNSNPIKVTRSW